MAAPLLLSEQTAAQRACLKRRLDALQRTFDRSFLGTDPLALVHAYRAPADQEIAGFVASGLAFGNVVAIQASVSAVLEAMGPSPAEFVDRFDAERDEARLVGLYHRWIRGRDLLLLAGTLQRMRRESGSLRAFFLQGHRTEDADTGRVLASFSERARSLAAAMSPAGAGRRATVVPFFPSPRDGSACKRLNLFLRWMVRGGDGLDLGLWPEVPRRQLVLPLDTHLVRLSRALGLTKRKSPGWAMAVEATRSLALLDPQDPVKYDFSLCRLGILDLCLHGRDPIDCRRCPPPRARLRRHGRLRQSVPLRGNTPARRPC